MFRRYYGPVLKAFEVLDDPGGAALERDLRGLLEALSISRQQLIIPSAYLEVIVSVA